MANNCLVTKLKEIVNNDTLRYLNFIRIHISEGGIITVSSNENDLTYIDGGVKTTIPISTLYTINTPTESANIGKYQDINTISFENSYPIDSLGYCENLHSFSIYGTPIIMSIRDFPVNLEFCTLFDCYIDNYGDSFIRGIINKCQNIQTLQIGNIHSEGTANISSYASAKIGNFIASNDSHVYGSIESFVSACRQIGRTSSNDVTILYANDNINITFNGGVVPPVPQGQQDYFTLVNWTPTTITCNGVTITA